MTEEQQMETLLRSSGYWRWRGRDTGRDGQSLGDTHCFISTSTSTSRYYRIRRSVKVNKKYNWVHRSGSGIFFLNSIISLRRVIQKNKINGIFHTKWGCGLNVLKWKSPLFFFVCLKSSFQCKFSKLYILALHLSLSFNRSNISVFIQVI